jgi:hypothetical protein
MKHFAQIACILSLILFGAAEAFACSCANPSVREKFRAANSVFIGQVTELNAFGPTNDFPLAEYLVKFKVEKRWKGSKKPEISAIANFDRRGWCGDLNLTVGERYLIYADHERGQLLIQTDCGPNMNLKDAGDEMKRLDDFWFWLFARLYPYPNL